mmetsp:Transcript_67397/g.161650  ORF Transcript_67397/g.161650 Transcript_67397/m.161650 type:complete len:225 (+) Transcript_67397:49-723(+)
MGRLSEEELAYPERVSPMLKCGICFEVFLEPVFFAGRPCQHCFCAECIHSALSIDRRCPTCRKDVAEDSELVPHEGFSSMIDEIIVRCGERHCSWTGRVDARPHHHEDCVHRRVRRTDVTNQELVEKVDNLQSALVATQARVQDLEGEVAQLRVSMQENQAMNAMVLLAIGCGGVAPPASPTSEPFQPLQATNSYWQPCGPVFEMRGLSMADRNQRRLGGLHED